MCGCHLQTDYYFAANKKQTNKQINKPTQTTKKYVPTRTMATKNRENGGNDEGHVVWCMACTECTNLNH